jgi:large subunit ribosomal protein L27
MAHTKAQGSSSNGRDSHGQRLGVKIYGGQAIAADIGPGQDFRAALADDDLAGRGSDDTLFAKANGVVTFEWASKDKKRVSVYPAASAK